MRCWFEWVGLSCPTLSGSGRRFMPAAQNTRPVGAVRSKYRVRSVQSRFRQAENGWPRRSFRGPTELNSPCGVASRSRATPARECHYHEPARWPPNGALTRSGLGLGAGPATIQAAERWALDAGRSGRDGPAGPLRGQPCSRWIMKSSGVWRTMG